MAVSRMGLYALLTIIILFTQASATQSPLPSTTPKTWLNYIWSRPSTTISTDSVLYVTGIPSHSQGSLTFDQTAATSTPPSPKHDEPSLQSKLVGWLSLHLPFEFNSLTHKGATSSSAYPLDAEPPQKAASTYLWNQDAEDHSHETKKEKFQRMIDCAGLEKTIEDETDQLHTDRAECGYDLMRAYVERRRRGCCDFARTAAGSQPPLTSALKIASQYNSELPNTTPAPALESRVHTIKWCIAETSCLLADLIRLTIALVIMAPPAFFLLEAFDIYRDGGGFQPGEAADFVIDVLRVEEFYATFVHTPYVYLRRKILRCSGAAKAWIVRWKVSKRDDKDAVDIPIDKPSARGQVKLWFKNLEKEGAEKNGVYGSEMKGVHGNEQADEDGEWQFVDKDKDRHDVL